MAPKRHARRAVTRSLVKRLARAVFARHEAGLDGGLWLLRLRQPLSKTRFVSARSPALVEALRAELDRLLAALAARSGAPSSAQSSTHPAVRPAVRPGAAA